MESCSSFVTEKCECSKLYFSILLFFNTSVLFLNRFTLVSNGFELLNHIFKLMVLNC